MYLDLLRDTYNAETQLIKALPKLARAAADEELSNAFQEHLGQTQGHVERLRTIFEEMGERPGGQACEAMKGLVEEGGEAIEDNEKGPARDAALIVGAQKVEHYEMVAYGSLSAFAKLLGHDTHVDLLNQTLEEERNADDTLNKIATETVNASALGMSESETETA